MQVATGGSWAPSFCSCSQDSGLGWVTATPALRASCCLVQEHLLGPKHVMWDPKRLKKGAKTRLEWRWLPPCAGKPPPYLQQLMGDGAAVQMSHWLVLRPWRDQWCPASGMSPRQGPVCEQCQCETVSHCPCRAVARGTWVTLMSRLLMLKEQGSKKPRPLPVQPPVPQESTPSQFPQPTASSGAVTLFQGLTMTVGIVPQHPPGAAGASLSSSPPQPLQHRESLAGTGAAPLQTQDLKKKPKTE